MFTQLGRSELCEVAKAFDLGEVISFQQKDMPADVATVLDQYRNVVPL